jgi:hypothetical protein
MDESDQMNRSPFGPAQFQKGFGGISPHRNSTGPVARKRKFPVLVSLDSQQVATSGRFGGGRRLESKKRPNTSRALEVEAIAKSFSNSYGQIHGSSLGEIQRRQAAVWCHHIQTCRGKGVRAAGTRVSTKPSCKRFWEAWQVEQEEGMVEAEEIGLRRNNGGGDAPGWWNPGSLRICSLPIPNFLHSASIQTRWVFSSRGLWQGRCIRDFFISSSQVPTSNNIIQDPGRTMKG